MNEMLKELDVVEIQKYQQNKYPCLFVDYIDEVVVGFKPVTGGGRNEVELSMSPLFARPSHRRAA